MSFSYTHSLTNKALTYQSYRDDIKKTLAQPATSESEEKMRPYLEKNSSLMDELDGRYEVSKELRAALESAPNTIWLVLTEGWCGDAAFNVPMLAAVEKAVPHKVKLKLLLRDENQELMDVHLTNGGRSIPKLIVITEELEEVGTWGPRPSELQMLMKKWKSEGLTLDELIPKVHEWYQKDNTRSIQQELQNLIHSYSKRS